MNYLLIILCAISLALQASIRKSYSDKVSERGTMLFNGCSCFVAAMFFGFAEDSNLNTMHLWYVGHLPLDFFWSYYIRKF